MADDDDRKRTRSPAYPFIDLKEAIVYAKQAYEEEDRHSFTPEVAATHWGYKATSSAVSQVISALKQFGLLVEEPGNSTRRLRFSPLGLDLMVLEDETAAQWPQLLKSAALNPKIHREIWEKYGGKLPSDQNLKMYLLREREVPFNKDQVDKFISQMRATIGFANLTESDKMSPADDDAEAKQAVAQPGFAKQIVRMRDQQKSPEQQRRPQMPSGTKEDVFNLGEGPVVLQYPETMSPESFEDFESWLKLVIRKAKRGVQADEAVRVSDAFLNRPHDDEDEPAE
jgi:hypothetical protein